VREIFTCGAVIIMPWPGLAQRWQTLYLGVSLHFGSPSIGRFQAMRPHPPQTGILLASDTCRDERWERLSNEEFTWWLFWGQTYVHQSFHEENRTAMGNETISLHFTKSETTFPGEPLDGLLSKDIHWASGTGMDLIIYQVLQTLR